MAFSAAKAGRFLAAGLCLLLIAATPAKASGPAIGPLCIDGVKEVPHRERASTRDDGVWTPTDYSFDRRQSGKALVVVLDRPITPSRQLEGCAAIQRRMVAAGARTVLSGRVRSLKLNAQVFSGPAGNRIQIDPHGMDLVLASVEAGAAPVAGGTIDLRGSHLWIKVARTVLAAGDAIEGELEIEAYNRRISGAHVTLGGGLDYVVDLAPRPPSNVTVHFDLASGRARLWDGKLTGKPRVGSADTVSFPFMRIERPDLPADRLDVEADSGTIGVEAAGLRGSAQSLSVAGSPLTWLFGAASLTIGTARGTAEQRPERLAVASADLATLAVTGPSASLGANPGSALLQGSVTANFARLGEAGRSGTSSWTATASPALSFLMTGGLTRATWSEEGDSSALTVSGTLEAPKLSLGGIDVSQAFSASLAPTRLSGEMAIPIRIDLPAAKGSVSFLVGDQQIGVEGRLDRLAVEGRLVIPVADLGSSHFEVDTDKVQLAVGAAVSVSPVIAGAKANFLDAEVAVRNSTALWISRADRRGVALLSTDILVLVQPVFRLGEHGTARQATVDLNAEGGATVSYDLSKQRMGLARAKLRAHDVSFSLLGTGEKTIDLGGTLITDPVVSLKELTVYVDKLDTSQHGEGRLEALSISAGKVLKVRPPSAPGGLAYAGIPTKPITLVAGQARRTDVDDEIAFVDFDLDTFEFAIKEADVDLGSGTRFSRGDFSLKVGRLIEAEARGHRHWEVSKASLAASGQVALGLQSFSTDGPVHAEVALTLDGPEEALNGAGRFDVGSFSGTARSVLTIRYDCRDTHHLDVDMEGRFAVGGARLNATMTDGRLRGDAAAGPFGIIVHSTHGTKCDAPSVPHVVAKKGTWWTDGVCNKGFTVYHCRWESPEIGYAYHITMVVDALTASAMFTNPHLYLDGDHLAVCNVGAVALANIGIVGGYLPVPETKYPGLDQIAAAAIRVALEPYQSFMLTTIGNGLGWLVSSVATTGGNVLCLGKPL